MKSKEKLNRLTINPIYLLIGRNHAYLGRVFIFWIRAMLTIVVLMLCLVGVGDNPFIFIKGLGILYLVYFAIDKMFINKRLESYNAKFSQAIQLIEDKEFAKGFRKLIKFGLKDSMIWIFDNRPEILTNSITSFLDKNDIEKINKIVKDRNVDKAISFVKLKLLQGKFLNS